MNGKAAKQLKQHALELARLGMEAEGLRGEPSEAMVGHIYRLLKKRRRHGVRNRPFEGLRVNPSENPPDR